MALTTRATVISPFSTHPTPFFSLINMPSQQNKGVDKREAGRKGVNKSNSGCITTHHAVCT